MAVTNGYCTLTELKAEKGISDTTDDSILEASINAASRMIDGVCGQRFWQDSTLTARTFYPTSAGFLDLLDVDSDGAAISTATGLAVALDLNDVGTYGTTLASGTDFVLEPTNAATRTPVWPYTSLRLTGVNGYWFLPSAYHRPTVQITAKWGWPAIPDDVHKACLIQSQQLADAKNAAFGVAALAAIDGAGMRAQAWNPLAYALLRPYMRPAIG